EGRGSTEIHVEVENRRTTPITLPVASVMPGIASLDQSGSGPGMILNEDGTLNSVDIPSPPGSVIMFLVTGGGQTTPRGIDGKPASVNEVPPQPVLPVSVSIGEADAPVLSAGGIPGVTAGIMQVNARIPSDAPVGDALPLVVTVGGVPSQAGIAISV